MTWLDKLNTVWEKIKTFFRLVKKWIEKFLEWLHIIKKDIEEDLI